MATREYLQTELAKIEAKLASGVEEVIVDGTKTRVNVEALQKERVRLQRRLEKLKKPNGYGFVRPVDLGGF